MASFQEWEKSLKEMSDESLEEVVRSLWAINKHWRLFKKEYGTDMFFLQNVARQERDARALKANKQ